MTTTIDILCCAFHKGPFTMEWDGSRELGPDHAGFICKECAEKEMKAYELQDAMHEYDCNTDLTQKLLDQHADSPVVLDAIREIRWLRAQLAKYEPADPAASAAS